MASACRFDGQVIASAEWAMMAAEAMGDRSLTPKAMCWFTIACGRHADLRRRVQLRGSPSTAYVNFYSDKTHFLKWPSTLGKARVLGGLCRFTKPPAAGIVSSIANLYA
jgi:hypothetical protein